MGWLRRTPTVVAQTPIPYVPEVTYKWRRLADGTLYHWWTCNRCEHRVGTCGYRVNPSLEAAVRQHIQECGANACGEPSCINCTPEPVVIVDAV